MATRQTHQIEVTSGFVKFSFSLIFLAVTSGVGLLYALNVKFEKLITAREYEERENKEFKSQVKENITTLTSGYQDHQIRIYRLEQAIKPNEIRVEQEQKKRN